MFDQRGRRKYLNALERVAYFKQILTESDESKRAFCLTLFHTGCRISEAIELKKVSIDAVQKCIIFETLKRRQKRVFRAVPIPDSLLTILTRVFKNENLSARIWQFSRSTGYRTVKHHMAKAGISGGMAMPKGLRHAFGVACVSKSIPISAIKKWLGHSRIENTVIYLDVLGEEERILAKRLWNMRSKQKVTK